MAQLLHFPDELLCQIFDYLGAFDAIYSLVNLNSRLNRLLLPFKQQMDFTHLSHEHFMTCIHELLPVASRDEPLYAVKLGNRKTPGQIELFNALVNDTRYRGYFTRVEQVTIESPRLEEFIIFVEAFLLTLPSLKTLCIQVDDLRDEQFQKWTQVIVNFILSMSKLEKLSIAIPTGLVLARLSSSTRLDRLVDVTLNVTLITDLLILIRSIPNVERLAIRIGWWASADRTLGKMFDEMPPNRNDATPYLPALKRFRLTIESILTFHFEHFDALLRRIMNSKTTLSFSFTLTNSLHHNNELSQLMNGHQWENLLSVYSSLTRFNLFMHIRSPLGADDEQFTITSFQTDYFLARHWRFSYFKYATQNSIIFHSTPHRTEASFDISIGNDDVLRSLPRNYTPYLNIDQTSHEHYQFNASTFARALQPFRALRELRLTRFNMDYSTVLPVHMPRLHALTIDKERNSNLSGLLQTLPLINTLSLSYAAISNRDVSSESVEAASSS